MDQNIEIWISLMDFTTECLILFRIYTVMKEYCLQGKVPRGTSEQSTV